MTPAYSWQWGDDLVYWENKKGVTTSKSEGGIYLVERTEELQKVKLPMGPELRDKWVFCVLQTPTVDAKLWPDAFAPYPAKGFWGIFGVGSGVVARQQNNLPTKDLTTKLIHLVRNLAKPLQEQTDEQLLERINDRFKEQDKRSISRLVDIRNEAYPVGGFRMAGEKNNASFATPEYMKQKKD